MQADPHGGYRSRAEDGAKEKGAYYTPDPVVRSLLSWAVRSPDDRLLDPSCGDGRFIAGHAKSVGIEQDPAAGIIAMQRAPGALIHEGDFFSWAGSTEERFECAAGNPPFIRYQLFKGPVRKRAIALCNDFGARFNALASSWPMFLVATAHLVKDGGRMAFVVPAEIGHAPYSAPLIEYLADNFSTLQIIAVRKKLFPDLSEDCWLLYVDGKGGHTDHIGFTPLETFSYAERPPAPAIRVPLSDWRGLWNKRLRPFLMPASARDLYERIAMGETTERFGAFASINIGYVSGANDFFHLRPSDVERFSIPEELLFPSVRNSRALPAKQLNASVIQRWQREDRQSFLLRLNKEMELPAALKKYLRTSRAKEAASAYKCRVRDPWYVVPDVKIPDFFLSYMSGRKVAFVQNAAKASCTNSVHAVTLKDRSRLPRVLAAQESALFQLSCEIEGHPLGGGMLKLEPREACNVLIPQEAELAGLDQDILQSGIAALQSWRHYETA